MTKNIFTVDDALYDFSYIKSIFLKNSRCLLGFRPLELIYNGVKYKNCIGIDFDINVGEIEIAMKENSFRFRINDPGLGMVKITKDGIRIIVETKMGE